MKTTLGLQQKDEGLRTAAFLIHCSLIPKKDRADIGQIWPMPFDPKKEKTLPGWNAAQMRLLTKAKQAQSNG